MSDDLGDRMKLYENIECGRRFMPLLPVIARVDGRAFHSFTRGLKRPYDDTMTAAMIFTATTLMLETGACIAYTQSDEISLAWHSTSIDSQIWFDGRIAKMVSQLAAHATLAFYRAIPDELRLRRPTFDARAWQVPNRTEGANAFLWREWDATKNSLTMAASSVFSHVQLQGKNSAEKHDMLFQVGINWNDYPVAFKRGTYVQRRRVQSRFTTAELALLPPKHAARADPNLMVERWQIQQVAVPPLASVSNREAFIFDGAEPIVAQEPPG